MILFNVLTVKWTMNDVIMLEKEFYDKTELLITATDQNTYYNM